MPQNLFKTQALASTGLDSRAFHLQPNSCTLM